MKTGALLVGRYRVERPLSSGTVARTPLLARDISQGETPVVLRPVSEEEGRASLLFQGARHPSLCRILGLERDTEENLLFIVSEYVEGENFQEARSRLSNPERLSVVRDVVSALGYLHGLGLAHGDIKPQNVVVNEDGRGVLIDPAGPEAGVRGTLHYLAPERIPTGAVSEEADLYSVGALLFESVADRLPFEGQGALELIRSIFAGAPPLPEIHDIEQSEELRRMTASLLAPEPSLRPQGARSVEMTLNRVLGQKQTEPSQNSVTESIAFSRSEIPGDLVLSFEGILNRVAVGDEEAPYLALIGGRGSGRTTALDRLRNMALLRGFVCLHLSPFALDGGDDSLGMALERATGTRPRKGEDPIEAWEGATDDPILLIVDDFHRACLEVVGRVGRWIRGRVENKRVFVVVAGEAEGIQLHLPRGIQLEGGFLEMPLLGVGNIQDFIQRSLPDLQAADVLAEKISERTGGHPAAMRALVGRFSASGGILSREGTLVPDLTRLSLVEESSEVDSSQVLASLTEQERECFFLVASVESPLGVQDVSEALEVVPTAGLGFLRALERKGFLRRGQGESLEFELFDPRDREWVRGNDAPRSSVARRLGRSLLQRAGADPLLLGSAADLLVVAGGKSSSRVYMRAAQAHFDNSSPNEALDSLKQVKGRPRLSKEYRVLRARALAMAGFVDEATGELKEEISRATGKDARVLVMDCVHLLERAGSPDAALELMDGVLSREDIDDQRPLLAAKSWCLYSVGQESEGFSLIDQLIGDSPRIELTPERLEVVAVAAALFDRRGDRRKARITAVEARRISRSLGRITRAAHFDSTLGAFDIESGHEVRGLKRLLRSVGNLERVGDQRLLPDALVRLGFLQMRMGEARDALDAFRRAVLLFGRSRHRRGKGWALNGEGSALLELGRPAEAAESFDRSMENRLAANASLGAALSAINLYRARQTLGDVDAARVAANRASALSRGAGAESARASLYLALAETAADERDQQRLLGYSRRALDLLGDSATPDEISLSEVLRGESLAADGHVVEAMRLVRSARCRARDAGARGELSRATALRAAVHLIRGRKGSALAAFEAALEYSVDRKSAVAARLIFARGALISITRGELDEVQEARQACVEAGVAAAGGGNVFLEGASRSLQEAISAAEGGGSSVSKARHSRALQQVLEASRWINEAVSVKDVLSRIIDAALRLTRAGRGFIVVRAREGEEMSFAAARNLTRQDILDPGPQLSRHIADQCMRTGKTVVTSEARVDERFRKFQSISNLELLSVMCAPLRTRDRVLGAIYVDDPTRVDRFDDEAKEHLEALADHAAIALEKASLMNQIENLNRELKRDLEKARSDLEQHSSLKAIITNDTKMGQILELINRVADSDAPVLIEGAPGTGKELIARALHYGSHRRNQPFVPVNCASIPESLVESELFGYTRGAFSGALRDREGLVATADGGTLFLDEVGETPLSIQAKLLRVLQDGEYLPLGSNVPRTARIRLVSATHRPLKELIEEGAFREDLFYRVRVVQIDVPPLRERRGDIPLLVHHFIEKIARETGEPRKVLSEAALEAITRAPFKGNVRELQALVRSLVLTVDSNTVDVNDLPEEFQDPDFGPDETTEGPADLKAALKNRERQLVEAALVRHDGNRVKAAEELKVTRRWLQKLIEKHGIS